MFFGRPSVHTVCGGIGYLCLINRLDVHTVCGRIWITLLINRLDIDKVNNDILCKIHTTVKL